MRRLASLVLALLAVGATRPVAARPPDPRQEVKDHVQGIVDALWKQLPVGQRPPQVSILQEPAIHAEGSNPSVVRVTTGLLASLETDAQLAMVLGYEQARGKLSTQHGRRASGGGGRSTAAIIGQAAAAGAAVGAVSEVVDDALRHSEPIVRGAVRGAAVGATAAAVWMGFNRRPDKMSSKADDEAASLGMKAVIAAGYDGHSALEAWDLLMEATPLATPGGGYDDHEADQKRQKVSKKVLSKSGKVASGRRAGRESYSEGVLAHLDGHQFVAPAPPTGPWLVYERSGGITGWMARVSVDAAGLVTVETRTGRETETGTTVLSAQEMADLRAMSTDAVVVPPREPTPDRAYLRDGQNRRLTVGGTRTTTVELSDGFRLLPGDLELIRFLEELASP